MGKVVPAQCCPDRSPWGPLGGQVAGPKEVFEATFGGLAQAGSPGAQRNLVETASRPSRGGGSAGRRHASGSVGVEKAHQVSATGIPVCGHLLTAIGMVDLHWTRQFFDRQETRSREGSSASRVAGRLATWSRSFGAGGTLNAGSGRLDGWAAQMVRNDADIGDLGGVPWDPAMKSSCRRRSRQAEFRASASFCPIKRHGSGCGENSLVQTTMPRGGHIPRRRRPYERNGAGRREVRTQPGPETPFAQQ